MRKQSGISALKMIFVIALGILMAGFIGCVASLVFTGAMVTGVATAITQKQTIIPSSAYNAEQVQKQAITKFVQEQRQIQLNRPKYKPEPGKSTELTRQDVIDYKKKTGGF
ncbi:MAG: hypothetical protein WCK96_19105 [Methylococcales bacterium]